MTNPLNIEWDVLEVEAPRKSKHSKEVYLQKDKTSTMYNRIVISSDLIKEANWAGGDRVTLMKARGVGKMYAIRRQNEGDGKGELTLKCWNGQYIINGQGPALALEWAINGDKFDAWVDNDKIIMRPRKVS